MQKKTVSILGSEAQIPKKIRGWNHTFELAKPYIKSNGIGIDVGCREGGFAREMENDFTHIHCFDFRDKKKMFKKNVLDMSKFTYYVCGIGDKEGTAYTTSNKVGRIKDNGNIPIPMTTIDSFNFKDVTLIKYDIEGYELKALKGTEKTIKKYSPVVVIEQNRGNNHAQDLLESWGYKCKHIDKVFNQDYIMVKENV
jgi:FkbM family methyltransferase